MTVLRDKQKRNALRVALYERLGTSGLPLSEAVQTLRKILARVPEQRLGRSERHGRYAS